MKILHVLFHLLFKKCCYYALLYINFLGSGMLPSNATFDILTMHLYKYFHQHILNTRKKMTRKHRETRKSCRKLCKTDAITETTQKGSPAATTWWPNAGLMLACRLRRRPNIKPALGQCLDWKDCVVHII